MIDDEAIGPVREITTARLATCDLCGQVAPRLYPVRLAGLSGVAEPVEVIHVCQACRIRVEQDDVPFDEEVAAGLQAADE